MCTLWYPYFSSTPCSPLNMPKVAQSARLGLPPARPAAQDARHREYGTEEQRREWFADRQGPGVFTPSDFAAAGFFLPEQEVRADKMKIRVDCWFCGVAIDQWEEGDDLLEEHLLHTRDPRRPREGGCRWALYLRDKQRYESGKRVRAARESSAKEVCRGFSISSLRKSKKSSSSTDDADPGSLSVLVEAVIPVGPTSSPSGALPAPPPKKKGTVPPPPPPKPAASIAVQSEEEPNEPMPAASRTSEVSLSAWGKRALLRLQDFAVKTPV